MSRLDVPLIGRLLWTTGDILLRAEMDLLLKDDSGVWKVETFRVDPGTEMTTMPALKAKSLGLPYPKHAIPGLVMAGQEVRAGIIRARFVAMDGSEFVFPCYFVGDPDSSQSPSIPKNLLGLTGEVNQIMFSFNGTPTAAAPYGVVVVESS